MHIHTKSWAPTFAVAKMQGPLATVGAICPLTGEDEQAAPTALLDPSRKARLTQQEPPWKREAQGEKCLDQAALVWPGAAEGQGSGCRRHRATWGTDVL